MLEIAQPADADEKVKFYTKQIEEKRKALQAAQAAADLEQLRSAYRKGDHEKALELSERLLASPLIDETARAMARSIVEKTNPELAR